MIRKSFYFIFASLFIVSAVIAQDDFGTIFSKHALTRLSVNPAFDIGNKRFSYNINSGGFLFSTADNLFTNSTIDADGNTVIRLEDLSREDSENLTAWDISLAEFNINVGKGIYLSAGWKAELSGYAFVSEDIINLAIDGNAPYLDETLELSPILHAQGVSRLYLGASKRFGKLSAGLKLSHLSGIASVDPVSNQINLRTDSEFYALQFDNDYEVNLNGGVSYNGLDSISFDAESQGFGANPGWGVDLGVSYELSNQLTLHVAYLGLGSIDWSDSPQNFSSKGVFEYEGVDINDYLDDDAEIDLTDSLEDILQIVETNNPYSTQRPRNLILGADYEINDKWRLGGVINHKTIGSKSTLGFAVSGSARLAKWIDLGLVYSYREANPANIGLHTTFLLGPVVLSFSSDQLFVTNIQSATHAGGRIGLGLRL